MAVLNWTEIVEVDRVRACGGEREVERGPGPGSRLPAFCTATGKLLLAFLPEEEQRRLVAELKLAKDRAEGDHEQASVAHRAAADPREGLAGEPRGKQIRIRRSDGRPASVAVLALKSRF